MAQWCYHHDIWPSNSECLESATLSPSFRFTKNSCSEVIAHFQAWPLHDLLTFTRNLMTLNSRSTNRTDLLADKVLAHLTKSGVGVTVDRSAVDVVTEQVGRQNEDADVGERAEVDELLNLVLEVSLVDHRDENPLNECCPSPHNTAPTDSYQANHNSQLLKKTPKTWLPFPRMQNCVCDEWMRWKCVNFPFPLAVSNVFFPSTVPSVILRLRFWLHHLWTILLTSCAGSPSSHWTASSSAEWNLDKPPISCFNKGHELTKLDSIWVLATGAQVLWVC